MQQFYLDKLLLKIITIIFNKASCARPLASSFGAGEALARPFGPSSCCPLTPCGPCDCKRMDRVSTDAGSPGLPAKPLPMFHPKGAQPAGSRGERSEPTPWGATFWSPNISRKADWIDTPSDLEMIPSNQKNKCFR